jgi:hypothetical protein
MRNRPIRRAHVRAAAEFHRVTVQGARRAPDLHHAHRVPVFVAEELHHVLARLHFRVGHFRPAYPCVFEDAFVDQLLNVRDLLRRERRAVERRSACRTDEGTFLRGSLLATSCKAEWQVRDRVVALNHAAAQRKGDGSTRCRGHRRHHECSQCPASVGEP